MLGRNKSKKAKLNKQVAWLKRKIKRWDRYKEEIGTGKRKGKVGRWSVAGLTKHLETLEKLV